MRLPILISLFVLQLSCGSTICHAGSLSLENASKHYRQGEYEKTISLLNSMLSSESFLTRRQLIESHKLLGAAHLNSGNRDDAAKHFEILLKINHQETLDPIIYSPQIHQLLAESRAENLEAAAKLSVVEEITIEPPSTIAPTHQVDPLDLDLKLESIKPDSEGHRQAIWPFALPFGVGQFKNNQDTKGLLFLGLQSSLLATMITSFAIWQRNANQSGLQSFDTRTPKVLFYGSLVSFAVSGVVGGIDGVRTKHRQLLE